MNKLETKRRPKLQLFWGEVRAYDDEHVDNLNTFLHDSILPAIRRQVRNLERQTYLRDIRGVIQFSVSDHEGKNDEPVFYTADGAYFREGPLPAKTEMDRYYVSFPLFFHGTTVDLCLQIAIAELKLEWHNPHNRLLAERLGQAIIRDIYSRLPDGFGKGVTEMMAIPWLIRVYPFSAFRMEDVVEYLQAFGICSKHLTSLKLRDLCDSGDLVIAPLDKRDRNRAYTNPKTRYAHTSNFESWLNRL